MTTFEALGCRSEELEQLGTGVQEKVLPCGEKGM